MAPITGLTAFQYSGAFMHSALLVRGDLNADSTKQLITRETLIDLVREHGPVMTLHKQMDGYWVTWDTINLLTVAGVQYLKCLDDGMPVDDLGDASENSFLDASQSPSANDLRLQA